MHAIILTRAISSGFLMLMTIVRVQSFVVVIAAVFIKKAVPQSGKVSS